MKTMRPSPLSVRAFPLPCQLKSADWRSTSSCVFCASSTRVTEVTRNKRCCSTHVTAPSEPCAALICLADSGSTHRTYLCAAGQHEEGESSPQLAASGMSRLAVSEGEEGSASFLPPFANEANKKASNQIQVRRSSFLLAHCTCCFSGAPEASAMLTPI